MGIARPSTNRTDSRSVFMYLSQNLSKLFHSQRMHPLLFPLLFKCSNHCHASETTVRRGGVVDLVTPTHNSDSWRCYYPHSHRIYSGGQRRKPVRALFTLLHPCITISSRRRLSLAFRPKLIY